MRAAILSLIGIAPTTVLSATYLAANLTTGNYYMGVYEGYKYYQPTLVSNTTYGHGTYLASRASINNNTELFITSTYYNRTGSYKVGLELDYLTCLDYSRDGNTTGFFFDKDGTLAFRKETGNGFRVCHDLDGEWSDELIFWGPTYEPLKTNCSYVSFTAVKA